MAATATTIRNRIETTIKAITPTANATQKFHVLSDDPESLEDEAVWSGNERAFEVWFDEGSEGALHHSAEYENAQWFDLGVAYPLQSDHRALDARVASDRHDIKAALDNPSNWGSDVSHQALLKWDAPERGDRVWILRLKLLVTFIESST